jgi:ribosomal protein L29
MKKNSLNDYRSKSISEIESSVKDLSVKLTSAYLTKSAGKLQNVSMIKNFRRDIAQLKTIIRQKSAESQS